MTVRLFVALFCLVFSAATVNAESAQAISAGRLVRTPAEFSSAMRAARPGDTIVLADGQWQDFQMLVSGQGQAARPITVTAQTPGGVILTGQSNLRIAGRYLVVANLVFRDGYSPTGEVISFRRNREDRATDSRVTGMVIDGFSKPDRRDSDNWVALYGQNNRFDHNHIVGKTNAGTTLVVVRDAQQGLANHHRIDHNYFGPRPSLGSNGGETLRVGTSHDAESDSFTTVEFNWFDHCDGEIEIISNKSGANVYRGNVFFESRGALTLRHGDGNLVEDNVFIGNGVDHTGGIRVINRNQTIRNNYMQGLMGTGFASALTVMYGVPNSPANRYVRVENAVIENNTIIDSASIFLGAGMDAERSAAPVSSRMASNLIVNADGRDPFRIQGDMSGLALEDNIQSPDGPPPALAGVRRAAVELERSAGGLQVPVSLNGVGARADLRVTRRQDTGVAWYVKGADSAAFDSGRTIPVAPGDDTLTAAFVSAQPGDQLVLSPGVYVVNQVLAVSRVISVRGPDGGEAIVNFSRPTLFEIARGGSLKLGGLTMSGALAPDSVGNAVIRTGPGAANYRLVIEDSRFTDLNVNRAFDAITLTKGTTADQIILRHVRADHISGSVLAAHTETDDLGFYNAEGVEIVDSSFSDIAGPAVDLYRGGTDESTFGPRIVVSGSTFERVGARQTPPVALALHGVQNARLSDNRFVDGGGVRFYRTVGAPSLSETGTTVDRAPATWTNLSPGPAQ
ncbi:polysaccharide lyase 6 family protein [uncultured Brevundimonas sp.]|uniref:polysaccharide lyase 6 family protein n=1 Tax=uncultured Brevundimonas sp. TaxID=213418 RepID=UPI0030EE6775|tara:strand:+ start:113341 stop:115554 length:2214 start_codon:yes stop_codon:yes gene_type:complete